MEMTVHDRPAQLTLGPVLFNWNPELWRDFYFRIADEAPVDIVYLGEVICFKRAPLFEAYLDAVAARLVSAGKTLVHAGLAEVMTKQERTLVEESCRRQDALVEANDGSALMHLKGRPHHVGPFVNVYNERTLKVLAANGACGICLPPELPRDSIGPLADAANGLGVSLELQVFGRMPLALSARCYHARAHGRTKDTCQFVCENDPDGMILRTLDDTPFLVVNGIQTMSHTYLNLVEELGDLRRRGVGRFRLSPHACDMVAVASIFRDALDGCIETREATSRLEALGLDAPFCNGFYYRKPGMLHASD